MFAQVIVGLDSEEPRVRPEAPRTRKVAHGARYTPGSGASAICLTLMRVVIVGFLTVIIGHADEPRIPSA